MTLPTDQILALNDAGHTPASIAATLGLALGPVYAVLRAERPKRPRAPRTRTSAIPPKVLGLHRAGVGAGRIAALLKISRAYVHRIVAEQHS